MSKVKQTTDGSRAVVPTAAPLSKLAKRINGEHKKIEDAYRRCLESARAIGQLLLEAKKLAGHRHWKSWLTDHVNFSERSAQNYMRLAEKWDELVSKSAETADLTIDGALRLLSSKRPPEPEPARTIIDQTATDSVIVAPPAAADVPIEAPPAPQEDLADEQPTPTIPAAAPEPFSHQGDLFGVPTSPGAYDAVQATSVPTFEPSATVEAEMPEPHIVEAAEVSEADGSTDAPFEQELTTTFQSAAAHFAALIASLKGAKGTKEDLEAIQAFEAVCDLGGQLVEAIWTQRMGMEEFDRPLDLFGRVIDCMEYDYGPKGECVDYISIVSTSPQGKEADED